MSTVLPSPRVHGWRLGLVLLATVVAIGPIQMIRPTKADAAPSSVGWLHTAGSQILTATNQPYTIKAVSWFGMETSNCAPHGLWQISLDAGLAQIKSFGFNTIRLPFSSECLAARATTGIDATRNPSLINLTPLQLMDTFVARAEAHGLSVFLDRHRLDSAAQSALWYTGAYPESTWIADWKKLAQRYRANPTVIGVDLHNEPHGAACWGCADPALDWAAAATRGGNAVLADNPKLLVIVEGVEVQGNGDSTWWGGGLSDVAAHPLTLAVAHQLVYSAHDYPASIFAQPWFRAPNYPANLSAQWDKTWGYLQKQNYTPVLLGEFGSKLETTSDQQWLASLVSYLHHQKMSFAYWSFNPNSGDTGGLVADDWVTPRTPQLTALAPLLTPGASDRYAPSRVRSSHRPVKPPTVAPQPAPPSTTQPAAPGELLADWTLQSSWPQGYVGQIHLVATGATRNNWHLSWADPSAVSVANAWGMTCTVASGRVSCTGAGWASSIPSGGSVDVGVQVNTTGPAPSDPQTVVS